MLLSRGLWDKAGYKDSLESVLGRKLVGLQGIPLNLHGAAQVQIQLKDELFPIKVIVADMLTAGVDVILGRDHQCTIAMGREKDTLYFKDHGISIVVNDREQPL